MFLVCHFVNTEKENLPGRNCLTRTKQCEVVLKISTDTLQTLGCGRKAELNKCYSQRTCFLPATSLVQWRQVQESNKSVVNHFLNPLWWNHQSKTCTSQRTLDSCIKVVKRRVQTLVFASWQPILRLPENKRPPGKDYYSTKFLYILKNQYKATINSDITAVARHKQCHDFKLNARCYLVRGGGGFSSLCLCDWG